MPNLNHRATPRLYVKTAVDPISGPVEMPWATL
jgi:hypothetical protein